MEKKKNSNDVTELIEKDSFGIPLPGHPINKENRKLTLPGCELLTELGSGGMGTVFLARQKLLNRYVAVKCLKVHDDKAQGGGNILDEAVTMAALNHQNIVSIHEIIRKNGVLYVIMEFIPGRMSVRDLVQRFGPLPQSIVSRILCDVVSGLIYMHSKGYIHRDLKPDNLLLYTEGMIANKNLAEIFAMENTRIKICDFGIATHTSATRGDNAANMALGSPNYMAPEQFFTPEDTDFRSDIYALASTAYFMLTGKPPFEISDREQLLKHKLEHNIPSPRKYAPKLLPFLEVVLAKMGCCAQDQRYSNYDELEYDLQKVCAKTNRELYQDKWKLTFWRNLALYLCVLIVLGGGIYAWYSGGKQYYRGKRPSLTNSYGNWVLDRNDWEISNPGPKSSLLSRNARTPAKLKQSLFPGQTMDCYVKINGDGKLIFDLKDGEHNRARLIWMAQNDESSVDFILNGNLYPLEEMEELFSDNWQHLRIIYRKNSLALYINREQVFMSRIKNAKPAKLTLYPSSDAFIGIRQLIIYPND